MGAIAKPITNLTLLPSHPPPLLLHEYNQLNVQPFSDPPHNHQLQHYKSNSSSKKLGINCRATLPSFDSASSFPRKIFRATAQSSIQTTSNSMKSSRSTQRRGTRSKATRSPLVLPGEAIITSDTSFISHPRDLDYNSLHKDLAILENLFIESPSNIVDIDPENPSNVDDIEDGSPIVIFDTHEDDPNNVTMNIDRRTRSRRNVNIEETSCSNTIVSEEMSSTDNELDMNQSMRVASPSTLSTMTSGMNRRKTKNEKKTQALGTTKRGQKVFKNTRIPSSKIKLKSQKHEQTNIVKSPDSVVNVRDLLLKYGGSFNLMAHDWSKLDRELLSVKEERCLAFLMKPFKKLKCLKDNLKEQLGVEPSYKEWAQASNLEINTLKKYKNIYEAARNKLIKLNLRLVKHQARKYLSEATGSNMSLSDLCQEGVKGLIVAVERFDPTKGFRFSTYAIFWIRNSILRAQTRAGHPIRIPFNVAELRMNLNKIKWELKMEGEKDRVSNNELMRRVGVTEERYKTVMRSHRRVVSLQNRDRVTGLELIQNLADPNDYSPFSARYLLPGDSTSSFIPIDPSLRLGIDDVLDSLKPKESFVLRQRFGLDGKGERALGEIGRTMKISREMVRKYEARALLKLKHPNRLEYLRSFLSP